MAPLRPTADIGEHKLSVLSSNAELPKWGFGSAERFPNRGSPRSKVKATLQHTQSTTTVTTAVPASAAEPELGEGFPSEDEEDEPLSPGERRSRSTWAGGWTIGGNVSRLDTTLDRFQEPPDRACNPRPKQYDPAKTIGEDAAVRFHHAPNYSFGGGKSRIDGVGKPRPKRAPALQKSASEGSAQRELEEFLKKNKGPSRGFGTCVRLRYRGGHLQLPESPGPAAYEVARECDMPPQWAVSTTVPWGKRTGARPAMRFATASDAGPGEYTAHHTFLQASGPSPVFAHPLRGVTKDDTPEPGRYEAKSYTGSDFKYSFGSGGRSDLGMPRGTADTPGPGWYYPDMTSVDADTRCATFSRSKREHPCEGVDPDEPPGPGAHVVRQDPKASDKPSAGLPKDAKGKSLPGMGPLGLPGPGQYKLKSTIGGVSSGLHLPLPRPIEDMPGPGEYNPEETLTREAPPQWRSPQRTAPRRPPWEGPGMSDNASGHQALINRAIKAAEAEGGGAATEKKMVMKLGGPKYSLGRSRVKGGAFEPKKLYTHAMVGTFSSTPCLPSASPSATATRPLREAHAETAAAA